MSKFDPGLARYRVIRVSCVEPGYPRIYLQDILRTLKPRVPHVAIGLSWNEPDVASVLKLQPATIGFTLPASALGPSIRKTEGFARMHAAVEQARHHGVSVGVEGDIYPAQVRRLVQDGVSHICSLRIWPTRPSLAPAEIWPASRLGSCVQTETAA